MELRGLAWDHRRCWGPLEASIPAYRALTGIEVSWDRRSLFSFGEDDLSEFARQFDLVVFDHPHVGTIARTGIFLDLSDHLSAADMARFEADSVGASWQSYHFDGGIWGLPVDAAAQTAAWRPDLMDQAGLSVPSSFEDVLALSEAARKRDLWVAWPAKPTDLLCTFLSLLASAGAPAGSADVFVPMESGLAALDRLAALLALAPPLSREWNPIQCLDLMSRSDEILYIPYTFNYVNYSSAGQRPVRFGTPPRIDGRPARPLLGGAGIGISAFTPRAEQAIDYARYLCSPDVQAGFYVEAGGQPGSRTAWLSDACNETTDNFFANTLAALDAAYLRPVVPGFVPFFHAATMKLAAVMAQDEPRRPLIGWMNDQYERLLSEHGIAAQAPSPPAPERLS